MKADDERYCDDCYWAKFEPNDGYQKINGSLFHFVTCTRGIEPCKTCDQTCELYEPTSRIWDVEEEINIMMREDYIITDRGSRWLKHAAEKRLRDRGLLK